MVASGVVHANVTCTESVKLPPFGEIVGVATVGVGVIVKLAEATALSVDPALNAFAFTVAEPDREKAVVNAMELDVGSAPSVV